jgi:hypothetical protein
MRSDEYLFTDLGLVQYERYESSYTCLYPLPITPNLQSLNETCKPIRLVMSK